MTDLDRTDTDSVRFEVRHPASPITGVRDSLIIATGAYEDPALPNLLGPRHDAHDLASVLTDERIGGFTARAIVDQSERTLRRAINQFLTNRKFDDTVLIYLSCHGLLDSHARLYFTATDTIKDELAATGIESRWLFERLEECAARRQIVILDCCNSGASAGTKASTDLDIARRILGSSGRGRVVLTSSRSTEFSYERLTETGPATKSVYTEGLVLGLRTGAAAADGTGYVTVEQAHQYAADHVRARGTSQNPQISSSRREDAIVLARDPRGTVITPAALPAAIQTALNSALPSVRIAGVSEIREWLNSTDRARVLAAVQALERVASQDLPAVAEAARNILGERTKPESEPHKTTRSHAIQVKPALADEYDLSRFNDRPRPAARQSSTPKKVSKAPVDPGEPRIGHPRDRKELKRRKTALRKIADMPVEPFTRSRGDRIDREARVNRAENLVSELVSTATSPLTVDVHLNLEEELPTTLANRLRGLGLATPHMVYSGDKLVAVEKGTREVADLLATWVQTLLDAKKEKR